MLSGLENEPPPKPERKAIINDNHSAAMELITGEMHSRFKQQGLYRHFKTEASVRHEHTQVEHVLTAADLARK